MAFGTQDDSDEVMNEINMTPMVDVMLVLLIVFIVTIPVMKHAVHVQLPTASSQPQSPEPSVVRLTVTAQGEYLWNDKPMDIGQLRAAMQTQSTQVPQPALHILGDKAVAYEKVAQAMSLASSVGLQKIGFVTEPAVQR